MRVFVTGASGFVGSAVVSELLAAGHQVTGLARSETAAAAIAGAGAGVHRGSLQDVASLRRGAADADAIVHLAFNHDFANFARNGEDDRRAIETFGAVVAGSERPLIVTSGLGLMSSGELITEDKVRPAIGPRKSEEAARSVAQTGARVAIVRLAPSVHGDGDHGFVPRLINLARDTGVSAYPGDGANRWPAVHRNDAARLYRLILEKCVQGTFHAVAEEGIPLRLIAEEIGRSLALPVAGKSGGEAASHFDWFLRFAEMDCPSSSARTRRELDWQPTERGLIDDLREGTYFA